MSVITLSNSPYQIHAKLAGPIYFRRACAQPCRGDCCDEGQIVHEPVLGRILRDQDRIAKLIRPEVRERRWFDVANGLSVDSDLPGSPVYVPTVVRTDTGAVHGRSCVFLNVEGLCALQVHGVNTGEHPWYFKPIPCWLYPLIIINKVVRLARSADLVSGAPIKCIQPTKTPTPGYELFRPELEYLLGQAGFAELAEKARAKETARPKRIRRGS